MDLYEAKYFDKWLDDGIKEDILREMKEKWDHVTNNNSVFISALEKRNIEALRVFILHKVRDMYQIRYPYRAIHF
jgi:GTP-binding protein HflX